MTQSSLDQAVVPRSHRAVIAVLLFASGSALLDLYLLGHYEDWWQFAPFVVLALVAIACIALLHRPDETRRRIFVAVMVVAIASGITGHWLHYKGNAEFEQEMYPDRVGMELFRESMSGATPVLAPGTMAILGLFGLATAWRPRRPAH